MASNTEGAWPIDPATPTGLFRTELGDTVGVEHDDDPSKADYQYISDAAIAALIIAYPGSSNMAMSKAVESMARQMIAAAQDIQVDDIRIKTVERATALLEYAAGLSGSAAQADADASFSVVPLVAASSFSFPYVQGQPRIVGETGF